MADSPDLRMARRSALAIIAVGLVLIALQLLVQLAIALRWACKAACDGTDNLESSHVGFAVLIVGTALMAVIGCAGAWRTRRGDAPPPPSSLQNHAVD